MNLPFAHNGATIYECKEINSSFLTGKLKIMYVGANRNGSYISKEAVIDALPTLRNVPIVAHWDRDAGEIGGHDMKAVKDEDGTIRIINLTEPVGVIPDHATYDFVVEADENGNEHEYLVVDGVILWKRQDAVTHIVNDLGGVIDHSMEITVKSSTDEADNLFHINKFEFTALCLLESAKPCFEGSELELFSVSEMKTKFAEMMEELKTYYTQISSPDGVEINHPQNNYTKGGEVLEDNQNMIAEQSPEVTEPEVITEPVQEEPAAVEPAEDENNFELNSNIEAALRMSVESVRCERPWGEGRKYWMVDFDASANTVYCMDLVDDSLLGMNYTMNGDCAVVDFESVTRKKWAIVDYNEGDKLLPFSKVYAEDMSKLYEDNNAVWSEKYQAASDTISSLNSELDGLKQFKKDIEDAEMNAKYAELFGKFNELEGIEAFEALKANHDGMSLEEIEDKCFSIKGRNMSSAKFSVENQPVRLPVAGSAKVNESEPYGGLFTKYKK